MYGPDSQITICLVGLKKVWRKKERKKERHLTCDPALSKISPSALIDIRFVCTVPCVQRLENQMNLLESVSPSLGSCVSVTGRPTNQWEVLSWIPQPQQCPCPWNSLMMWDRTIPVYRSVVWMGDREAYWKMHFISTGPFTIYENESFGILSY